MKKYLLMFVCAFGMTMSSRAFFPATVSDIGRIGLKIYVTMFGAVAGAHGVDCILKQVRSGSVPGKPLKEAVVGSVGLGISYLCYRLARFI